MNKPTNVPLILTENLDICFDGRKVLANANIEIFKGSFVGIIGPNGGGKTTLLRAIMGLLQPTSGSVSIDSKRPQSFHGRVGYVPQSHIFDSQYPLTVLDVVLMGALSTLPWFGSYSKETKEQAKTLLEKLEIIQYMNTPFGQLSGGQAQRVLIARSLISNPEILFLDEPTASIDPDTQTTILNLLCDLKGNMTIIMVTHHLQTFIKNLDSVICVQETTTTLQPKEVCKHFGFGVYHSTLIKNEEKG